MNMQILLPFAAIAAAWITSRLIKFFLDIKSGKAVRMHSLVWDGGMPSNHAAMVSGLATTALLETGLGFEFLISLVLAFIVCHDAVKLRNQAGMHAMLLNKMNLKTKDYVRLEERLGHSMVQVMVGVLIGVVVPLIVYRLAVFL
jgi:uncharacterized protein